VVVLIGGNLYATTCLSPSTLLTSSHWGRPLHVFGLTSEVPVVGAHMSLTMGTMGLQPTCSVSKHSGSCIPHNLNGAFSLSPGVCVKDMSLLGLTHMPD